MPEHRRAQRSLETVDIIHLLGLTMASLVLVLRWDVIDGAGWLLARTSD
jgi:hypothetical protein